MVLLKRLFSVSLLIIGFACNINAMDHVRFGFVDQESVQCAIDFAYYPYQINVKQFFVREQEIESNACGLHALHNAFCFMLAQNEADVLTLLKNDMRFATSREFCFSVNNSEDFSEPHGQVMVDALLKKLEDYYKIGSDIKDDIVVVSGEEAEWLKSNPKDIKAYEKFIIKIRQKRERFFKGHA